MEFNLARAFFDSPRSCSSFSSKLAAISLMLCVEVGTYQTLLHACYSPCIVGQQAAHRRCRYTTSRYLSNIPISILWSLVDQMLRCCLTNEKKILTSLEYNFRLQTPNVMTLLLQGSLKLLGFCLGSLKPFEMISIFQVLFRSTILWKDLVACTCGTAV